MLYYILFVWVVVQILAHIGSPLSPPLAPAQISCQGQPFFLGKTLYDLYHSYSKFIPFLKVACHGLQKFQNTFAYDAPSFFKGPTHFLPGGFNHFQKQNCDGFPSFVSKVKNSRQGASLARKRK